MIDLSDKKLELSYPCSWEYKLVVLESCDINSCVKDVLLNREHKISASKTSAKGKFKSYNLKLIVHSEDDRVELFRVLGNHKDIKMVL